MNTVQQPAADVAVTLLTPEKHYQRVSGLRSLSYSLNNMLAPALGTALYTLLGLEWVILFDLATFLLAFCSLLLFIPIPQGQSRSGRRAFYAPPRPVSAISVRTEVF